MFVKNNEGKKFSLAKGITSKILGHGGKLMLVENHFKEGVVAPMHSHENEQTAYIAKGKFEFTIGDEKQILETGDSFYVEANVPHGCVAIEEGIVVDIFTPQREDFLKKVD
ncbi:cupin domain-containing protein [Wukongibacter baidiensis]|uniref:cupin domain-containing protein n=1 Tax=Wukongibacter baidiensis TaxID=1723361 RepID=UPI003D7F9F42